MTTAALPCPGAPGTVPVAATVGEVMVRHPSVLPAQATVAEVRAELEDDHVHMVLLADDGLLRGTVVRGDLPEGALPNRSALPHATLAGRTVSPAAAAEGARHRLVAEGGRRLAVVDDEGRLLGLLCLKASGAGFCSDDDVRARRAGPG